MAEGGNIKTFTSPIDRLNPSNEGSQAFEMMGRHVAATYHQAGEMIGSAISGVGEQLEQHDTAVQTADVMKKMSDLEVQAHDDLLQAKTTMDPNDPNGVKDFMAKYQDQLADIRSQTYTTKAGEVMDRMTQDFETRVHQSYTGYQAEAQAANTKVNYETSVDNWAKLANRDLNFAKVGADAITAAGNSMPVPAAERSALIKSGVNRVYDQAAEGAMTTVEGAKVFNPAAADNLKTYLMDPKNGFVDGDGSPIGMSATKFGDIMGRLDNYKRMGGNQTIAGLELNKNALLENVSMNGVVGDDIAKMHQALQAVGTPEALAHDAQLNQEVQDKMGEYRVRQVINQTPSDKLHETKDALTNILHTPNLPGTVASTVDAQDKIYDKLANERHEAFYGGNPSKQGQWMIDNNPSVRNAYDQWRAAVQKGDDRASAAAFQNYYTKSVGQQRFLEPGALPSVLTADMEHDADRINHELDDPKAGPMQAEQDLLKMANTYGQAWPSIAGDLAKRKIFNGDQLVAAMMANDPHAQMFVRPLLQAAHMKEADWKTLPMSEAQSFKTVHDSEELGKLEASMSNINNAPEIIANYTNAAAQIVRLKGMEDATDLLKTMFTDRYQFVGPGSSIRLSADMPNGDAIGDGASSVLHDIVNHDLVVPYSSALGSVNAKEAYGDAIAANGVWNTSANGRTATLYDGAGNPVMERRNGKIVPVEIAFDELARIGGVKGPSQQVIEREEAASVK